MFIKPRKLRADVCQSNVELGKAGHAEQQNKKTGEKAEIAALLPTEICSF